jgi:hypothetical protein
MTGHILTALLALLVGYHVGWIHAHLTVSTECERLGAFFVGKQVYECKRKEKNT